MFASGGRRELEIERRQIHLLALGELQICGIVEGQAMSSRKGQYVHIIGPGSDDDGQAR